jgi:hypothetical protein
LGKEQSGAQCVNAGIINNFTANPSRVLKGNTTTITWSTSNMAAGGCTLTGLSSTGTAVLSHALSSTPSLTAVITGKTIFTLSCIDLAGVPSAPSITVNLIPQTIEQ